MKRYISLIIIALFIVFKSFAQKRGDVILIYPSVTKEHPVRIVLKENITDTISSNIILKYHVYNLHDFVFVDSFLDNKLHVIKNTRKFNYKLNQIQYLEFIDNNNDLRVLAHLPNIDKKNIVEIVSQGKINYYRIFSSNDVIASKLGYAYIEKDGKWIKHKKQINKAYFKKIKALIIDEHDLAEKMDQEEIPQEEIFQIIREYNSRKL